MVRETWVQSQVALYQRLKKWYLIPPCLALSNIRYISRVKWSNPGEGVVPSPISRCSSYWKGRPRLHWSLGEGGTLFPGLLHFNLDLYLIMLSVKQGGIKYHFLSIWYDLTLGLKLSLPDHWRTLYSWGQWPGFVVDNN